MTDTPRPGYHHGAVREEAQQAAAELLREGGPAAVTVRAIASRVGVTHAALYRHIESVESLFDTLAANYLDRFVVTHDDGRTPSVEQFLEHYARLAVTEPQLYRLVFSRENGQHPDSSTHQALTRLRRHAQRVFTAHWPQDSPTATMHRVIRTWSTVHGMVDLAALGLVNTNGGADGLARYVARSAQRAAEAPAR